MILAGDIGGTHTRFALFVQEGSKFYMIHEQKYASRDWQELEPVLKNFLTGHQIDPLHISAGCLSLAGPIEGNQCRLVNLGIVLDLKKLEQVFSFQRPLMFCNDLVATGYGLQSLASIQLACLTEPKKLAETKGESVSSQRGMSLTVKPFSQNRAILAPGTGLGESILFEGQYISPTEGAHVEFAPRTELEVRLWRFLHQEFDHVSYERILSGQGLVNLYRFLLAEAVEIDQKTRGSYVPSPEEITQKALARSCPICTRTLDLFVDILGAESGNLALKSFALGGIYLGGGIPPKILPKLKEGTFLKAFRSKGRMSELLANIPVYVILEEKTALFGAAKFAYDSLVK